MDLYFIYFHILIAGIQFFVLKEKIILTNNIRMLYDVIKCEFLFCIIQL